MTPERQRLLELAMESLVIKKQQIDAEIALVTSEMRGGRNGRVKRVAKAAAPEKRSRFTRTERSKRSKRMKAYWENWRKQKAAENK